MKPEDVLESPVRGDFAHDFFNTFSTSWASNLFQSKLFLSQRVPGQRL
jgi:hypothetical protein